MKANMWEFGELSEHKHMDKVMEKEAEELSGVWSHLGQTKTLEGAKNVEGLLSSRRAKHALGLRQQPTMDVD